MAQLDAIRYEIRSISIMNPGLLTQRLMDNPDQNDTDAGVIYYSNSYIVYLHSNSYHAILL